MLVRRLAWARLSPVGRSRCRVRRGSAAVGNEADLNGAGSGRQAFGVRVAPADEQPPRPTRTSVIAALLLADAGIGVTMPERHAEPRPLPRAVHLDDEVVRPLSPPPRSCPRRPGDYAVAAPLGQHLRLRQDRRSGSAAGVGCASFDRGRRHRDPGRSRLRGLAGTDVFGFGVDEANVTAGELAHGMPVTIEPQADVTDVLRGMEQHQIHRLLVIESQQPVSMISQADLARHLPETLVGEFIEAVCTS
jgi:CBS domain-containing protein